MQKYKVLGVVGEGAYGVVLKCCNKETGEVVAIKSFKWMSDSNRLEKTIAREVTYLKKLRHENIVWLIEAFKRKERLHLVFEFVDKNLMEIIEASPGGVDEETVRICMWQLVRALKHCHANRIVHRDIKPENLLLNPKTRALKLCDFGFARCMDAVTAVLTSYVATRWYRAPELLTGGLEYGAPVDLWAAGCIMGELIDQQPLFPGDSDIDQLYKIQLVLGPITEEQARALSVSPRYSHIKFPPLPPPEGLRNRYAGRFDRVALDFLQRLLTLEPQGRMTAAEALEHPYIRHLEHAAPRPAKGDTSACAELVQALQAGVGGVGGAQ
ncbi:cyclin-dependent kinase-like 5 [Cyclospora cayetanensis]|uniref:cyclin-dependent kinase n=1 Tax=Cyclospora cayetanensis TaxID=88456 RepID=A0A6P6RU27_9EIME|nr:cyclin-dependent kinase-like 5 [Cyclospora cayetanensis]